MEKDVGVAVNAAASGDGPRGVVFTFTMRLVRMRTLRAIWGGP